MIMTIILAFWVLGDYNSLILLLSCLLGQFFILLLDWELLLSMTSNQSKVIEKWVLTPSL